MAEVEPGSVARILRRGFFGEVANDAFGFNDARRVHRDGAERVAEWPGYGLSALRLQSIVKFHQKS
jgi:hypothetical protein